MTPWGGALWAGKGRTLVRVQKSISQPGATLSADSEGAGGLFVPYAVRAVHKVRKVRRVHNAHNAHKVHTVHIVNNVNQAHTVIT